MDLSTPTLLILGATLLFVGYLSFVLRTSGGDFRRPKLPERAQHQGLRQPSKSPVTSSSQGSKALPEIRPAEGAVAAGTRSTTSASGSGSDEATEAAGLLRILESSSDIQRQAAAKALSLPFAGTCHPEVALALAKVVKQEAAPASLRAEAWVALRVVMGEELDWGEEVAARHAFPEGLDDAWLAAILGE